MLTTFPFADTYTVTVILYIILLLENCVAFSMLGMSCLDIYGLIQNPLMVMERLQ